MSRRAATLANLVGTGGTTLVAAVQAIVLIPLYLKVLGPHLYGAWLGSGDILNVLQLMDLGLTNVLTQRIGAAHGRGLREETGHYFGASLLLMASIGVVMAALVLGLAPLLPGWMHLDGSEADSLRSAVRWAALPTFLVVAHYGVLALARGQQDTLLLNTGTVTGSIVGFAMTLVLVLKGVGLPSIVWGMTARSAIWALTAAWYAWRELRRGLGSHFALRRESLRDVLALSPATALAGLGQLLTSQTEAAIVAIALRPELAPVLILTRRAVDVASGLLNSLSYSAYAGYAHLVASPSDRSRALAVHAEITALWVNLALAASVVYVALNHSLVAVWAGEALYGGVLLTLVMAGQMIVTGEAQLLYYLYRATGAIVQGSWLQLAATLVRFPLMLVLLLWLGLPGFAVAGILTAGVGGYLAWKWTRRAVRGFAEPAPRIVLSVVAVRICLVAAALVMALWLFIPRWSFVIPAGLGLGVVCVAVLLSIDERVSPVRGQILARLGWFGETAEVRGR